ncbi:unnamed protein product, partial [Ectocarpus sp. 6 AP-2014]
GTPDSNKFHRPQNNIPDYTTTTLRRDAGGRRQESYWRKGERESTYTRALASRSPVRAARALICDSTSPRTRFGGPRGREISGGGRGEEGGV